MVWPLKNGVPAVLELPWPYGESALVEPRGYNHHGPAARRIVQRVVLENTGAQPLTDAELKIDGRDWRADLQCSGPSQARQLFTRWTLTRSHAASGSKLAQDPWQMLRIWGYTLCGEDTKGLSALLAGAGVEGRGVPLNGHVAGEYRLDGRWSVLDGDQNIVYFNLDNRTLAGYAEIRADPFLALRTKPYGRFAEPSRAASQFNAGLFEYVEPVGQKPFKHKEGDSQPAPSAMTLYPGERLLYHYDRSPEVQVGDPAGPEWKRAAPAALRLLELQVNPKARGWKGGTLEVKTSWPLAGVAEPTFQSSLPVKDENERPSVWMQRTRLSFPSFHAGQNTLSIAGNVTVRVVYETENLPPRPAPPKVTSRTLFHDEAPHFALATEEGCDRVWWQIASEPQFALMVPNFDQVQAAAPTVSIDPLSNTFLNDRADYFFRVKTVRQGVWSEWSAPVRFRVEKPLAPFGLTASALPGGGVRLAWNGPGEEFAIFASHRLDFLPELYADQQIVSMRGLEVLSQRPSRNRVGLTKEHSFDLKPASRYLRVIARRGSVWSNPSPLLALPPALCGNLPRPVVFQIRWTTVEDAAARDVYQGEERPFNP